ncbi:MAG: ArsR/SmtB family transcription factor [Bacillota bacterium]|jgi:DNA-binding transcriptional ArsR family regulator
MEQREERLLEAEPAPADEEIFDLADFFKIFGDSTRLRILFFLRREERCVIDIAKALDLTPSAVSHQLRTLKQLKLVSARREGKMVFYAPADSHIETILGQGLEHIRE